MVLVLVLVLPGAWAGMTNLQAGTIKMGEILCDRASREGTWRKESCSRVAGDKIIDGLEVQIHHSRSSIAKWGSLESNTGIPPHPLAIRLPVRYSTATHVHCQVH